MLLIALAASSKTGGADPHALESRKIAAPRPRRKTRCAALPSTFLADFYHAAAGFLFLRRQTTRTGAELLRSTHFGRIVFANSDLTGIMDRRASIQEAHRTVGQIVEQISARFA